MPKAEAIMLDNWCRKDSYKSLKTSSSIWLVTYDFDLVKIKQSKTLYELPRLNSKELMDLFVVPVILGTYLG